MNHITYKVLVAVLCSGYSLPSFPQYCVTKHGGQVVAPIITSVTLGSINNIGTNTPLQPYGYSDYTGQQTNLSIGQHTLTIGTGDLFAHNFAAWIDLDRDFEFEDVEMIGQGSLSGGGVISFSFSIPLQLLPGPTRLRIRAVEEPFGPWNLSNDPCIPFRYGETEDYTVVLMQGFNLAEDLAAVEILSPTSAVGLSMEPVVARIINRGINAFTFPTSVVTLEVDGVMIGTEPIPAPVMPGDTVDIQFSAIVNFDTTSCHHIAALLQGDDYPDNDYTVANVCKLQPVTGTDIWYIHSDQFFPLETFSSGTTNQTSMNNVFGMNNWTLGYFETIDVQQVFSPSTCTVFIDGSYTDVDPMENFLDNNMTTIEQWVASGGSLFLNSSPESQNTSGNIAIDLGFGGVTLAQGYVVSYAIPTGTHPIHTGSHQPNGMEWSAFYYANGVLYGPSLEAINVDNEDAHFGGPEVSLPVVAAMDWGLGKVVFGTIGASQLFNDPATSMNNRANILEHVSTCFATSDVADEGLSNMITLYPNPTTGEVILRLPADHDGTPLALFDACGRLLEHRSVPSSVTMTSGDMTGRASGMYLIKVATHGTTHYLRFNLVE